MAQQRITRSRWFKYHIEAPLPETALFVDRLDPDLHCGALDPVTLIVNAFYFQHQRFAVTQPDQIIRHEIARRTAPQIANDKIQMIVLSPRQHVRFFFTQIGHHRFPRTVVHHMADLRTHRCLARPGRYP